MAAAVVSLLNAGCATLPSDDPICPALSEVAAQLERGETSSARVFLGPFDPGAEALYPMTCEHSGDMRWRQVCPTIIDNTSHEFIGIFARQVRACLERHGRLERVETRGVEIGLAQNPPKLVEIEGRLGGASLRLEELENQSGYQVTLSRSDHD